MNKFTINNRFKCSGCVKHSSAWNFVKGFFLACYLSADVQIINPKCGNVLTVRCIASVYTAKVMLLKGQDNALVSQKPTVHSTTLNLSDEFKCRLSYAPILGLVLIIKDTPQHNYFLRLAVSFLTRGDCQPVSKQIKDFLCEGFHFKT